MGACNLSDAEHERLQYEARIGRDMSARVSQAELFVLAAAKCGFVDRMQYDCIILALEKLTALETIYVEMLLNVKPKQLR